jgi:hypothetical protein
MISQDVISMTENRKRLLTATLVATLCALLGGCVVPRYTVGVSGFADPAYAGGHSYWLLPGQKGVTDEDLEFREYAGYVRRGLKQAGFTESLRGCYESFYNLLANKFVRVKSQGRALSVTS